MRAIAVLALLVVAACDTATEPEPIVDAVGVWILDAAAGACSLHMRASVIEGTTAGFIGHGTLEFRRPGAMTDPHTQFSGSAERLDIHTIYPVGGAPFPVDPFTLTASEDSEDRIAGQWTCDGATGTWALVRE